MGKCGVGSCGSSGGEWQDRYFVARAVLYDVVGSVPCGMVGQYRYDVYYAVWLVFGSSLN